jgi:vacuolar protein sorting-associated protein 52
LVWQAKQMGSNGDTLGRLDITSDRASLRNLAHELERFPDSTMLGMVLDGGQSLIELSLISYAAGICLRCLPPNQPTKTHSTFYHFAGAEPRDFMHRCESQLRTTEVDAVAAFVAEADNLMALAGDIAECDEVLGDIENLLQRYQHDLGTVSTDIKELQARSSDLNVRLRNRRALQGGLGDFVERVALLPSLIHAVMESPPESDDFSRALERLDAKLKFVASEERVRTSAAFRDVAPELERLRLAAVSRARDVLMKRVWELRRPGVNVQSKQMALVKHRSAASFLCTHGGAVYTEVRSIYVDKVSSKYLDVFKSYWAAMERVEDARVSPEDLLGAPESTAATVPSVAGVLSMLGSLGTSGATASPHTTPYPTSSSSASSGVAPPPMSTPPGRVEALSLGARAAILAQADAPPLVLHAAEAAGQRFPFEVLFRSLSKLLMDTSAHEYLFCMEFWASDGKSVHRDVFHPVTSFVQSSLASALSELHDPIAVLLALRVNRQHALRMARRALPALDDHFDAINLALWPRLKSLLDAQLQSLKSVPTEPGSMDSLQASRVHPMAERYAALTSAILSLHAEFLDGPLSSNIERMRYAVMDLLLKQSRAFPQRGRGTVFLIHNFNHVVTCLKDAAERHLPAAASDVLPPQDDASASTRRHPSGITDGGFFSYNHRNPPTTITTTNSEDDDRSQMAIDSSSAGIGPAGMAVLHAFEESLHRATTLYVDARLTAGAPQLMAFVKRGEAAAAGVAEGVLVPNYGPSEAAPVARDFSARWQRIVEVLHNEIAADFGGGPAGRSVQQAAFTQLLLVWSRFLELVQRQGPAGEEVARDAVAVPSVMFALKQHRLG